MVLIATAQPALAGEPVRVTVSILPQKWMVEAVGRDEVDVQVLVGPGHSPATYEPTASTFGFRVPYMPEGFQFADFFDTYYGDLATVGDWSQAQPLQCAYPAPAPQIGDYLTVSAPQIPPPGQGYYYVTAVNYQGQRRYGRKASGGVLSGRDPAVLPACN